MPISFEKAVVMLENAGITTYKIRKMGVLAQSTLTKLRHDKCVTTDTIEVLCKLLNCQPGDLMEYIPDEEAQQKPSP